MLPLRLRGGTNVRCLKNVLPSRHTCYILYSSGYCKCSLACEGRRATEKPSVDEGKTGRQRKLSRESEKAAFSRNQKAQGLARWRWELYTGFCLIVTLSDAAPSLESKSSQFL